MYGERLKQLRKEKGLTIEELAKEADLSRSTYAGYEKEHRKPPLDTLIKLSNYFDVPTDYILGLTDSKERNKIDQDMFDYLQNKEVTWKGEPISEEELQPILSLLEMIVRDRMPEDKEDE